MPKSELVTIAEAVRRTGIKAQTLYKRIERGTLIAHPVHAPRRGRRWVMAVDLADLPICQHCGGAGSIDSLEPDGVGGADMIREPCRCAK